MSKMTKQELQRRKSELKQMVHADVVRREVMQFRLEPDNIEKLYQIALRKRKAVGTLVREWVSARIDAEINSIEYPVESKHTVRTVAEASSTSPEVYDIIEQINSRLSAVEALVTKPGKPGKKKPA